MKMSVVFLAFGFVFGSDYRVADGTCAFAKASPKRKSSRPIATSFLTMLKLSVRVNGTGGL